VSVGDERLRRLLKEARERLELERLRRSEPIAIVGIGCRFPGSGSSPAEFWELLANAGDAVGPVPPERWDAQALYDPDPSAPGKCYAMHGGFLEQVDGFEPESFGISPREARSLDPQQRLLLEVSWEALEDAGIPPDSLRGSSTGVWVGLSLDDYAQRTMPAGELERIDAYTALGSARSVAAGRIAYFLGSHGPALLLDTACSSSLVAVHLACQSLRMGECELALVGGVNVMSTPAASVGLCRLQALSRDGRCKTFDAAADGYGRGEGCGVVVLKRLSAAEAAQDRIYAVIRGSAVNHDGRSNGLTAPNGRAQEAVMRTALANAGLGPLDVDYVEAHGTGTLLGDPIEVLALAQVYGAERSSDAPLYVGSVKTNLGHLEAAAGVASLIKTSLCLARHRLVPSLHFHAPNPKIPWDALPLRVAQRLEDWPRASADAAAGVSSFGISGTNAHVILQAAPGATAPTPSRQRAAELFVLSARTEAALRASAAKLAAHVRKSPAPLGELAFSLATTRAQLERRACFVARSPESLVATLDALAAGQSPADVAFGRGGRDPGKLAWLFTGQGSQRLGMGQQLCRDFSAFREAFAEIGGLLDAQLDTPLERVMWAAPDEAATARLGRTGYTQPALFAFEWAMAALWRSWGIEPELLAGHSIGEITAACLAGVFSLDDAARLVCARGQLMQALPAGGAMVAIAATPSEVLASWATLSERDQGRVALAAVNAPASVVISGDEAPLLEVARGFAQRGVATKRLNVSHAFHSSRMDPMLEAFEQVARSVAYRPPTLPLVSNLSGALAGPEVATPEYWVKHARETVRFSDGVRALFAVGAGAFLELGPEPVLLSLVAATLPEAKLLLPASSSRKHECEAALDALGRLTANGVNPAYRGVFAEGARRVELPTCSWQRSRYWVEAGALRASGQAAELTPALASPAERARLRALPPAERLAEVLAQVRSEVARVLSMGESELAVERLLRDLGLDSLMAVQLHGALERRFELLHFATFDPGMSTTATIAARISELVCRDDQAPVAGQDRSADAVLEPSLRPPSASAPPGEPTHALLTGATGFLGAHLLHELLAQTSARVTCLVRGRDEAHAAERLENNLRHFGLWQDALRARLSVVVGELSEPQLGLGERRFRELASSVDAVYNNAAQFSFVASYDEMRPSHAVATQEILRLASLGRSKRVHHVSSLAVHQSVTSGDQLIDEAMPLPASEGLHLPYYQCKWVSERLMWAARDAGFAVTVHRPSFIGGSSVSGIWNRSDFVCRMLLAIMELGLMPGDLDLLLDFSPVDYVSRAMVHLSLQPESAGHAFHLQQPETVELKELGGMLRSLGYAVREVPLDDWVARVAARTDGPLYPLLPLIQRRLPPENLTYLELGQRRYRPCFAAEKTQRALAGSGIHCAPLGPELLGIYLLRLGFEPGRRSAHAAPRA